MNGSRYQLAALVFIKETLKLINYFAAESEYSCINFQFTYKFNILHCCFNWWQELHKHSYFFFYWIIWKKDLQQLRVFLSSVLLPYITYCITSWLRLSHTVTGARPDVEFVYRFLKSTELCNPVSTHASDDFRLINYVIYLFSLVFYIFFNYSVNNLRYFVKRNRNGKDKFFIHSHHNKLFRFTTMEREK